MMSQSLKQMARMTKRIKKGNKTHTVAFCPTCTTTGEPWIIQDSTKIHDTLNQPSKPEGEAYILGYWFSGAMGAPAELRSSKLFISHVWTNRIVDCPYRYRYGYLRIGDSHSVRFWIAQDAECNAQAYLATMVPCSDRCISADNQFLICSQLTRNSNLQSLERLATSN
jgi:hypothetical protein